MPLSVSSLQKTSQSPPDYFFFSSHLLSTSSIPADLPTHDYIIFPQHTAHTNQCPDIVMWDDSRKNLTIAELTISFESSMDVAHQITIFRHSKAIWQPILHTGNWLMRPSHDWLPKKLMHALVKSCFLINMTRTVLLKSWIIQNLVL